MYDKSALRMSQEIDKLRKQGEPPFVPTVTDELAASLALLLGAVDDTNDLHTVVLKRTAVEVARIALAHYQAQQDKGGSQ